VHNQQSIPDEPVQNLQDELPELMEEITCTSLTASYSSASANLSIVVLVKILLKSKVQR
jgi:hypothetical protein